jgi:hypothetical protein
MKVVIKSCENSKTKTNNDVINEMFKSEPSESRYQFRCNWIKTCTYKWESEESKQNQYEDWLQNPYNSYRFCSTIRSFFKKGDKVKCISSDPKLAELKDKVGTVYGKNANYIFVSFNEDLDWKLLPTTLVIVGQEEKIKIKLGQLFCIKIARMRPGYTADTLFKIVWKSSVNVRVVPLNPKYPINDNTKYIYGSNRPGDNVTEYTDETRTKYFRKSVYGQDIPIAALVAPDQYDKEDLELVMDLDDIGL